MGHAHAVAFGENIVGQIIFLIQPKKWRERVLFRRATRDTSSQNLIERMRKLRMDESGFFNI